MSPVFYYLIAAACIVFVVMIVQESVKRVREKQYKQLEADVLKALNVPGWSAVSGMEAEVIVKSRKTLEKYDMIKFFQENSKELEQPADRRRTESASKGTESHLPAGRKRRVRD